MQFSRTLLVKILLRLRIPTHSFHLKQYNTSQKFIQLRKKKFMAIKWVPILLLLITVLTRVRSRMVSYGETNRRRHGVFSTIQSGDGDIIDCVDIYRQPAFDHPALRDHKIQFTPSFDINMETQPDKKKLYTGRYRGSPVTETSQIWHENGSCPKGAIPIRRTQKRDDAAEEESESEFSRYGNNMANLLLSNHSMAILLTEGYAYLGAKGDISVWNPDVESDDEYTTSRVALKSGSQHDFEAIESGWAVNPRVYGDRRTRLYVYWTADGSWETGCFDLTCPGFVQTSNEIALGAAIHPVSNLTGLPSQITIYIHRDPYTGNWWVQYGERINLGYWPADLFEMLAVHAETVQWGGEVFSSRVGNHHHPHTSTAMGSGQFPDWFTGMSGSVKRMRVLRNNMELIYPEWVCTYSDEYDCYDAFVIHDYVEDPEFFYGGPGRNPKCP